MTYKNTIKDIHFINHQLRGNTNTEQRRLLILMREQLHMELKN